MEGSVEERLISIEKKIEAVYVSVEKTRRYFLATIVVSTALIIVPLIGLAFAIPAMLASVSDVSGTLDLLSM